MLAVLLFLIAIVSLPVYASAQRIIDDNDRIVLPKNVHPNARAEYDAGSADGSLLMERMILTLRRSADKQVALAQLLADQQNPASPNYHRWLTHCRRRHWSRCWSR